MLRHWLAAGDLDRTELIVDEPEPEDPPLVDEDSESSENETDSRFPSGPWIGFFLQKEKPGRHQMELALVFSHGVLTGTGRDWVGEFLVRGKYDLEDGRCHWTKRYVGKHDVYYAGFNEGKGIWGTWEIAYSGVVVYRGGFHIWPKGMANPTGSELAEEADLPLEVVPEAVLEFAGASTETP